MSDIAARLVERLAANEQGHAFPTVRPRDAATMIIIDRSGPVAKVLLGRRHMRHRFMPGKFVFPGGRIELTDRLMPALRPLQESHTAKLMRRVRLPSAAKAAGFALAAVRETYEETGLMLGVCTEKPFDTPPGVWEAFAKAGVMPDLSAIHFIARAITPPNRPLRFDSRFFAADVDEEAIRALNRAASAAGGLKPLVAETRDLFRRPIAAAETAAFDGALFDPPRSGAEAQANRVAHDRNFRSSGLPKISVAERPSTRSAASAHCSSRGPSTGWAR